MDRRMFVALADFVLQQAEIQSLNTKMFLAEAENSRMIADLRERMATMPDDEVRELRNEINAACRESNTAMAVMTRELKDAIARAESDREKMEAAVVQLKRSLGGGADPAV
jgi:predicted DNA-binding ArsR family transcriptional regulator